MISASKTQITYQCDGVTTQFSFPYAYYDKSHVVGFLIDGAGKETKITTNCDFDEVNKKFIYPVSGTAIAAPNKIKLKRVTELSQLLDLPDEHPYGNIEKAQDKLTMIMQELTYVGETSIPDIEASLQEQLNNVIDNKTAAAASEAAAKASETAAAASVTAAQAAQTAAETAKTAAQTAEAEVNSTIQAAVNTAVSSATASAAASANSASASADAAAASASAAATKAGEAAGSAGTATTQAGTATTKATEAASSAAAAAISANIATANGGLINLPNHIVKGGKVSSVSGLNMTHGAIESVIRRKLYKKAAGDVQTLPAKRLGLFTIDEAGNRGTVLAADPTTFIDNNTVGMWKPDGSTNCPNLAAGVSSSAVANTLTKAGTINPVDGIFGGDAAQGDGNTGSYGSANATNFPLGAAEREVSVGITVGNITSTRYLVGYGNSSSTGQELWLKIVNARVHIDVYGTTQDTGFDVEAGKTYTISFGYDGTNVITKINGNPIASTAITLSTLTGVLYVLGYRTGVMRSTDIVHFVELRNKMRSVQAAAEFAAKLLSPVCWTDPTTGKRKNLTSLLPDGVLSLGMFRTTAAAISYNDTDWQWARREGASGGNRVVTQDYKPVVKQSPASMQWTSPFGIGATYMINWRNAENTGGVNEVPTCAYFSSGSDYGVNTTPYTNGKIGVYVGIGGSAYVNGAWRTGGYMRPIVTLQEPEEEVPDVA